MAPKRRGKKGKRGSRSSDVTRTYEIKLFKKRPKCANIERQLKTQANKTTNYRRRVKPAGPQRLHGAGGRAHQTIKSNASAEALGVAVSSSSSYSAVSSSSAESSSSSSWPPSSSSPPSTSEVLSPSQSSSTSSLTQSPSHTDTDTDGTVTALRTGDRQTVIEVKRPAAGAGHTEGEDDRRFHIKTGCIDSGRDSRTLIPASAVSLIAGASVTRSTSKAAVVTAAGVSETSHQLESEEGCVLDVVCGEKKALLSLDKLASGSKGACVLYGDSWITPNEFQSVSGRGSAKDWKRSIKHGDQSLKSLISGSILSLKKLQCRCSLCKRNNNKSRSVRRQRIIDDVDTDQSGDDHDRTRTVSDVDDSPGGEDTPKSPGSNTEDTQTADEDGEDTPGGHDDVDMSTCSDPEEQEPGDEQDRRIIEDMDSRISNDSAMGTGNEWNSDVRRNSISIPWIKTVRENCPRANGKDKESTESCASPTGSQVMLKSCGDNATPLKLKIRYGVNPALTDKEGNRSDNIKSSPSSPYKIDSHSANSSNKDGDCLRSSFTKCKIKSKPIPNGVLITKCTEEASPGVAPKRGRGRPPKIKRSAMPSSFKPPNSGQPESKKPKMAGAHDVSDNSLQDSDIQILPEASTCDNAVSQQMDVGPLESLKNISADHVVKQKSEINSNKPTHDNGPQGGFSIAVGEVEATNETFSSSSAKGTAPTEFDDGLMDKLLSPGSREKRRRHQESDYSTTLNNNRPGEAVDELADPNGREAKQQEQSDSSNDSNLTDTHLHVETESKSAVSNNIGDTHCASGATDIAHTLLTPQNMLIGNSKLTQIPLNDSKLDYVHCSNSAEEEPYNPDLVNDMSLSSTDRQDDSLSSERVLTKSLVLNDEPNEQNDVSCGDSKTDNHEDVERDYSSDDNKEGMRETIKKSNLHRGIFYQFPESPKKFETTNDVKDEAHSTGCGDKTSFPADGIDSPDDLATKEAKEAQTHVLQESSPRVGSVSPVAITSTLVRKSRHYMDSIIGDMQLHSRDEILTERSSFGDLTCSSNKTTTDCDFEGVSGASPKQVGDSSYTKPESPGSGPDGSTLEGEQGQKPSTKKVTRLLSIIDALKTSKSQSQFNKKSLLPNAKNTRKNFTPRQCVSTPTDDDTEDDYPSAFLEPALKVEKPQITPSKSCKTPKTTEATVAVTTGTQSAVKTTTPIGAITTTTATTTMTSDPVKPTQPPVAPPRTTTPPGETKPCTISPVLPPNPFLNGLPLPMMNIPPAMYLNMFQTGLPLDWQMAMMNRPLGPYELALLTSSLSSRSQSLQSRSLADDFSYKIPGLSSPPLSYLGMEPSNGQSSKSSSSSASPSSSYGSHKSRLHDLSVSSSSRDSVVHSAFGKSSSDSSTRDFSDILRIPHVSSSPFGSSGLQQSQHRSDRTSAKSDHHQPHHHGHGHGDHQSQSSLFKSHYNSSSHSASHYGTVSSHKSSTATTSTTARLSPWEHHKVSSSSQAQGSRGGGSGSGSSKREAGPSSVLDLSKKLMPSSYVGPTGFYPSNLAAGSRKQQNGSSSGQPMDLSYRK